MLLGVGAASSPDARRLLLVKARIDDHEGEASAPAQGPMYLGAVARACGWQAVCIDTYLEDDPERAIRDALAVYPADVIGISALTAEYRNMHRFAAVAREARPGAVILAGGAHPSADPDDTAGNPAIDAAVIGEGEETLRDILRCIEAGDDWRHVPGLALRDAGGAIRRTPPRAAIEDLDALPLPAWDLTDIDAYSRRRGMSLAGQRRYMALTTSRGCPYRCTYCHDIQGKRFRSHSPAYVLRMMDDLREHHGVFDFDITDDIFNFDAPRMMEICDGMIARGDVRFTCPNGIRADRMTVEQAERMAQAGCQYVAIAIETATKRLQKQIRKHLRFDKVLPVIETFTRHRVFTSGFFMVGFPSETEEELRATIDFAIGSKLHAAYFFVVTPFGGTEMHEQVVDAYGSEATVLTGSGMFFRPQKNLSQVPDARFYRMRRNAYLRFYLDPRRVTRIVLAHPRRNNLVQYFMTMFLRDAMRVDPGRLLGPLSRARRGLRRRSGGEAGGASPEARAARAQTPPMPAALQELAAPGPPASAPPPAQDPSADARRRLPLAGQPGIGPMARRD